MTRSLFFLMIFIFCKNIFAQNIHINKLLQEVVTTQNDSLGADRLLEISKTFWYKNPDSSIIFANKALKLSKEINYQTGIGFALKNLGVAYDLKGDLLQALKNNLLALKIGTALKNQDLIGSTCNNIGNIYDKSGDHKQALIFHNKALDIARKEKDENAVATSLLNIGAIFKEEKQFDKAIAFETQAIAISIRTKDSLSLSIAFHNLAETYFQQKKYKEAIDFNLRSLQISNKIDDREGKIYCYNFLAKVFLETNNLKLSKENAEIGLALAKKFKSNTSLQDLYNVLSAIAEGNKDYNRALKYKKLSDEVKDSILNTDKQRSIENLKNSYELQQKQIEIDHLQLNSKEQNKEISKQTFQRNAFILGFAALVLLIFVLFKNISIKKKINKILEEQNAEIIQQKEEILAQSEQIFTQKELLLQSNFSKDKLFSIISHDLRSPINSLQGALGILQEGLLSEEEVKNVSKTLLRKVQNTGYFLNNLLYWAKSQMGGIVVNPEKINLKTISEINTQLLASISDEKNISIINNIKLNIFSFADENMVDLVIRNLIENAIKFTPANGEININAVVKNSDILISIEDSGDGIKEEDLPKLFDTETHFSTYGTSNEKGTGLGLTLCKDFIEKNKGQIWVESRYGKGSTFYFTLPAAEECPVKKKSGPEKNLCPM